MKAVVYRAFGPPTVLALEDVATPVPGDNELLIRVHAAAVNTVDSEARRGKPFMARLYFGPFRPRNPTLGGACAGQVEAIGTNVRRFSEGDQVVAISVAFGAHAEYLCVPEDAVISAKPKGLTHAEAVAVSDGGLTALPFLRDAACLRPGQSILVNGASGSVGTSAVQLAKHLGAEVTGVCSGVNVDLVRSLGADHVLDYTKQDFTRNGAAYDVVFDAVAKSSFARCRRALKPDGRYLTTVPGVAILAQAVWTKLGRKKAGIAFTGLRPRPEMTKDLVRLMELAEAGTIRPVIDRRYPLVQAAEAHRLVDTGHKKGTVILTIDEAR